MVRARRAFAILMFLFLVASGNRAAQGALSSAVDPQAGGPAQSSTDTRKTAASADAATFERQMHLGETYESKGELKSAEEAYRSALDTSGTDPNAAARALEALNRVLESRLANGADRAAIEKFCARMELGGRLEEADRFKEAEAVYREALLDAPPAFREQARNAVDRVIAAQDEWRYKFFDEPLDDLSGTAARAVLSLLALVALGVAITLLLGPIYRALGRHRGRRALALDNVTDLSEEKVGCAFPEIVSVTLARMQAVSAATARTLPADKLPLLLPAQGVVDLGEVVPAVAAADHGKLVALLTSLPRYPEYVVRATMRTADANATMVFVLERRGEFLAYREISCPIADCHDRQKDVAYDLLLRVKDAIGE
jgi:tetratricopeptide (TPR) repeat protein